MKKINVILLGIVIVLSGFSKVNSQGLQGNTWAQIQEAGEGTIIVTYFEEDAFAYTNEQGELTGVSVNIINHFFNFIRNSKNVTLNVEFVQENDFGRLYSSVRDGSGGVFGIANVTITEARKQEIAFSPAYLTNIAVLISHSNTPDLTSIANIGTEFSGKTGILYTGTTHEARVLDIKGNYYPAMQTVSVTSDDEVIRHVSSSENYFGYVDLYNYWLATQNNIPIKRQGVGDQASENFGIIMPLDSDWRPLVDEFFNLGSGGYRASATYRNILVQHLGTEVTRLLEIARRSNQ